MSSLYGIVYDNVYFSKVVISLVIPLHTGIPFGAKFLADAVLADVIDYDEFLTGARSEATYVHKGRRDAFLTPSMCAVYTAYTLPIHCLRTRYKSTKFFFLSSPPVLNYQVHDVQVVPPEDLY